MAKKLYDGIGEAVNDIANVEDAKEVIGIMLKGETTVMGFITGINPDDGAGVRMNRKYTGNVDNLISAGSYRIGTSATGTPNDGVLAWMEVRTFVEQTGLDVQLVYIAQDGTTQTRMFEAGSWNAWA